MKKILILLAAAALFLPGCMKKDDTFERLKPVMPGLWIYDAALSQNVYAMQPADVALRVAMLAAQAEITPPADGDLEKVMLGDVNVKNRLLGLTTRVAKDGDGNLTVTFSENVQCPSGFLLGGKVKILTNGKAQLADTNTELCWQVQTEGFLVTTDGGNLNFANSPVAQMQLYANGVDGYTIAFQSLRINPSKIERYSNWSGSFDLKIDAQSLAYQYAKGKEVTLDGSAMGPSVYPLNNTGFSTSLRYEVTDGRYNGSIWIYNGKVKASIIDQNYDKEAYPSTWMTSEWAQANGVTTQTVTYNNVTVIL